MDCISYAAAYSGGKLAEHEGLPPEINILLSLGIGITATKVAGKYLLKDAKGAVIGEIHDNSAAEEIKTLKFKSWDDFKLYIQKIGKDNSLTNEDKVWCMQQAFGKVADKTDICIPSDAKYIKGFTADGQIQYDWPKDLGFDKTTVSSISRNNRLPEKWDRYGSMRGSNFADVPSSGKYSASERSIPYVENEAAYHCGKFNNTTYFDKIDAIKAGNLDALNKILKSEGISPVSESYFEELGDDYKDFITKTANKIEASVDATYGLKGKAAAWGDLKGGAEQIVTPFNGKMLKELGMIN